MRHLSDEQIEHLREMIVKATKEQLSEDLNAALTELLMFRREKSEREKRDG